MTVVPPEVKRNRTSGPAGEREADGADGHAAYAPTMDADRIRRPAGEVLPELGRPSPAPTSEDGGPVLVPTTADHPCIRCGGVGWCFWLVGGERPSINCHRDATGSPREGGASGTYYRFFLDDLPEGIVLPDRSAGRSARPTNSALTPDQQHQGYSALASVLPLAERHRRRLRQRGIDVATIARAGYRTLPEVWDRGRKADMLTSGRFARTTGLTFTDAGTILPSLAGYYWREDANPQTRDMSDLRMGGAPGILIPIRDLTGRIRAYQVRVDDRHRTDSEGRDLGKYRFFSDSRGPKLDYFCHVPAPALRPADCSTVRLTEGPLKADVATALGGVLTLGVPGVGYWSHFLPVLAELRPDRVQVCWDADAAHKVAVAESARDLVAELLVMGGPVVELATWDESLGKGIDDVLQAGHGDKVRLVEGDDALKLAEELVAKAHGRHSPRPNFMGTLPLAPDQIVRVLAHLAARYSTRQERLDRLAEGMRTGDREAVLRGLNVLDVLREQERRAAPHIVPYVSEEEARRREEEERRREELRAAADKVFEKTEGNIAARFRGKPPRKGDCGKGRTGLVNPANPRKGKIIRNCCNGSGCAYCCTRKQARAARHAIDAILRNTPPTVTTNKDGVERYRGGVARRPAGMGKELPPETLALPLRDGAVSHMLLDDERAMKNTLKRITERLAPKQGIDFPGYFCVRTENGWALFTDVVVPGAQQLPPAEAAHYAALVALEATGPYATRFGGSWKFRPKGIEQATITVAVRDDKAFEILERNGATAEPYCGRPGDPGDTKTVLSWEFPEDTPEEQIELAQLELAGNEWAAFVTREEWAWMKSIRPEQIRIKGREDDLADLLNDDAGSDHYLAAVASP